MAWQFSCARKWAHSPHPHSSRGFLAFRRPVIARARKPSAARATFDVLLHYSKQNARNSPWNKFLITIYQVTCLNSSAVSYLDRNATLVSDTTIEIRNIRIWYLFARALGTISVSLTTTFIYSVLSRFPSTFLFIFFSPHFISFLSPSNNRASVWIGLKKYKMASFKSLAGIFTAIIKTDKDSDCRPVWTFPKVRGKSKLKLFYLALI